MKVGFILFIVYKILNAIRKKFYYCKLSIGFFFFFNLESLSQINELIDCDFELKEIYIFRVIFIYMMCVLNKYPASCYHIKII